jgi:plastocyanin
MRRVIRFFLVTVAALVLAACTSGGNSPSAAPGGSSAGTACRPSTTAGGVAATIAGFKFAPDPVAAKAGDTIGWTNNDSAEHSVVLDTEPTCATPTLGQGKAGAITFVAPGTYRYHCGIHGNSMTGSITISS